MQDSVIHKDLELVIPNGVCNNDVNYTSKESFLSEPIPVFIIWGVIRFIIKG